MTDEKIRLIKLLVKEIPELTEGQLEWLHRVTQVFSAEHYFKLNIDSIFDEKSLQNFGDALRIHHSFSSEPFSKDKFEYVSRSSLFRQHPAFFKWFAAPALIPHP